MKLKEKKCSKTQIFLQKKYFGRLFLAFVMLLGGVFFTTSESKAAYDYVIPTFNEAGNVITIPEYTGEAILVCSNNGDNANYGNFVLGTATSTQLLASSGFDYSWGKITYLENPQIGDNAWSSPNQSGYGVGKCVLFKNYDSNIGISYTLINSGTNYDSPINLVIPPNENETFLLFGIFSNSSQNDQIISNASSTEILNLVSANKYNNNYLWETVSNVSTSSYQFSANSGQLSNGGFWQINIGQQTAPQSNDYVMYYGANPVYTPINSNYNLPVVYNVCDNWEDGKIILKLNNDNASSSEKLLTQCSGTFNFNSGAGSSEMSNTSYFTIENFSNHTILATSASFLSTVYKPLTAKDGFIVWNFPAYQYFDYTKTATTTDLAFQYNVCSDTNYATSSQICIRNTSHPTNNPTSYCTNLATCSGTSTITLPIFSAEKTLTLNFSYYDKNNNYQLGSNEFSIVYYNGTYDTRAKWLVQAGEIACSPEEWASTDWWVNIKCGVFTGGVAIAQTLGDSAAAGVKILVGMLDGVFPFNLPIKIKECWDNSETELLPTELNKINILDESGNVKVNLPTEWAASSSITMWGSDIWNSTTETNEYFDFIRYLSKYFIWGLFILIFYLWGKSLIEK